MLIHSAQTPIQEVVLPKTPAVSFQIGTEVKFGDFGTDLAACPLVRIHFEFCFLGDNNRFARGPSTREAGYWTKMAPCADHQPSPQSRVGDPLAVPAFDGLEIDAF